MKNVYFIYNLLIFLCIFSFIHAQTKNGFTSSFVQQPWQNNLQDDSLVSKSLSDIIINEVMFNHPENGAEYVELYNRTAAWVDCSGFICTTRKGDGSLNTGVKLPAQTLMPPYSYLAITTDVEAVKNHHACPDEAVLIELKLSALNNESASIILCNADKTIIYDEFQYHSKMHHVLIKNVKGVALERINPDGATQDADNWHSAANTHHYGTPGFENSQYRAMEFDSAEAENFDFFYLENEVFTPDNDGVDDVCLIHYEFPESGYMFSATILSAKGGKIYTLAEQVLAASKGRLVWDGRTAQGRIANIGIYVLLIEIIYPEKGFRKLKKLPIVLSSQ